MGGVSFSMKITRFGRPQDIPIMDMTGVFEPKTLAIFGVSLSNPFNPTNIIYHKNRLRYQVATYAINPKGGDLFGERIYRNLEELPEKAELAVVGVRADFVPGVIKDCIKAGVRGAVIISGGFAESGRQDLQDEVATLSHENDFPVIGPNCLGVYSPPTMDTFFLPPERLIEVRPGGVSLVSQSGGILVDLMIKLTQEGAGVARGISIGNRAALDEVDLLEYFNKDPKTKVIGLYLEGFGPGRGRKFAELMVRIEKPVVFIKSGKTDDGRRAVASHTASVAGDYRVMHDVMAQYGALEADTESKFVAYCVALSSRSASPMRDISIITASGGHGAIASDAASEAGLSLPRITMEDQAELRGALSPSVREIASLGNPIDLTGSASDIDFINATRLLLSRDYIGGAVILLLPYLPAITPDVGARIALASAESNKPVVVYIPQIEKYGIFIEGFEANGIPVSHTVQGAVHMARALAGKVVR